MTMYGHLHFNWLFRELFALTDEGMIYRSKKYEWNKIEKIDKSFGASLLARLLTGYGLSFATIYLKDGNKIRINGRVFTKKGERPKLGIVGFITAESKAFNDIIDMIEKRIGKKATESGNQGDWR